MAASISSENISNMAHQAAYQQSGISVAKVSNQGVAAASASIACGINSKAAKAKQWQHQHQHGIKAAAKLAARGASSHHAKAMAHNSWRHGGTSANV